VQLKVERGGFKVESEILINTGLQSGGKISLAANRFNGLRHFENC